VIGYFPYWRAEKAYFPAHFALMALSRSDTGRLATSSLKVIESMVRATVKENEEAGRIRDG
jgi:hypothetical protein